MIKSINYNDQECVLVNRNGKPVSVGDKVVSSNGENYILVGGRAPHKSNSEGKAYVSKSINEMSSEYYVSVFELSWINIKDL
jgi:hypothetical protein